MPPTQYLFLSLADRSSTSPASERQDGRALPPTPRAGGRCIGTAESPLLAWPSAQADEARAAAERAALAHGRLVEVLSRGDAAWEEGREIRLFTDAASSALRGPRPRARPGPGACASRPTSSRPSARWCARPRPPPNHEEFVRDQPCRGQGTTQVRFGGGSVSSAST